MRRLAILLWSVVLILLVSSAARAAGTFKLRSTEVNEVSGAWHIYCTVELPKAPSHAHQTMRFVFTPTAVYERSLIDGHNEPVTNRQALQNQSPSSASLDIDFADPSGKIWKGTHFDFGLTRTKGYQAGEYEVKLRTSDGVDVGGAVRLTLKGDNPVVDRRAITFNAKEKSIKKVDTGLDGGTIAKATVDDTAASPMSSDVQPSGKSEPFVPQSAYNKTAEEEVKERPKGCGCTVPGSAGGGIAWLLVPGLAGIAIAVARRRRK
jgi:MYXO-CTERM domain-containing protein